MSLDNIIKVSFGATNKCRTRPLYVLDYGIFLQINDDRINDSTAYSVHFSKQKAGSYYSVINTEQGVKIPEALLQSDGTIYAWLYYHTGESDGETLFEIEIPIITRPDTPAVIPTPHDHDLIEDAIAALNAGVEEAREYAAAADASAIDAAGSADDAAASATTAGNAATAAESSASTAYTHAQDANSYAVAAGNAKTAAETAQGKAETAQGKAESARTAAEAAAGQTALDVVAAGQSANAAAGSAGEASGYANDASEYATVAQGFANNASGFADNASGYATNAYNSAQAAAGFAGEASGYASDASGYATAAGNAKTDAEAAQTSAETAQGLAEAAQTGAEAAQTAAETARDAAIAATEDKAPVILDSASGDIVSIVDGAGGMNDRSLVASMSPIQDLHGYNSPWPAGGGKNLFPDTMPSHAIHGSLDSGTNTIVSATNSWVFAIPCEQNTDYTFSDTGTLGWTIAYGDKLPEIGDSIDYRGSMLNRDAYTQNSGTHTYILLRFSNTSDYEAGVSTNKCMVEKGSTATAYAPYSNICPISGRTGLTAYRTGVNLWGGSIVNLAIGTSTILDRPSYRGFYCRIVGGESYTVSRKVNESNRFRVTFTSDEPADNVPFISPYSEFDSALYGTVTAPADANWIFVYLSNQSDNCNADNYMIELGSTVSAYEPYTGTSYPVSWQSEAGTVYGGTVDVVTGVLTVDREIITITTVDGAEAQYGYKTIGAYGYVVKDSGICNVLKKYDGTASQITNNSQKVFNSSGRNQAQVIFTINGTPIGSTGTERRESINAELQKLSDAGTPLQICYELETPQTYQLDPQTVSMLLGANNVWSTGDSVSLTYPCDTKLYMERLTAPTEDDMIANANIASGTYFMVGNRLFRSTASIPNGTEIIIGTNCVPLSLADALNALNE